MGYVGLHRKWLSRLRSIGASGDFLKHSIAEFYPHINILMPIEEPVTTQSFRDWIHIRFEEHVLRPHKECKPPASTANHPKVTEPLDKFFLRWRSMMTIIAGDLTYDFLEYIGGHGYKMDPGVAFYHTCDFTGCIYQTTRIDRLAHVVHQRSLVLRVLLAEQPLLFLLLVVKRTLKARPNLKCFLHSIYIHAIGHLQKHIKEPSYCVSAVFGRHMLENLFDDFDDLIQIRLR